MANFAFVMQINQIVTLSPKRGRSRGRNANIISQSQVRRYYARPWLSSPAQ